LTAESNDIVIPDTNPITLDFQLEVFQ